MRIGDEIYVHGYVDEIRQDTVIIRNDGGYFGTAMSEMREATQEEREGVNKYINSISDDVPENNVGNIPTGTKFVIEVGNAHEDVDGSVYHPVKDQGWWSISEERLDKLTKLDDVLLDYTPCKEMDARCDKAYQDGYNKGIADGNINDGTFAKKIEEAYKNGLDIAWAVASDITYNRGNVRDIIGKKNVEEIFDSYTAQEVLNILERHEQDEKILPDDWMDIEADMLTHDQAREAVRVLRREVMKLKEKKDE